jgi:hypothetical protein
VLTTFLNGATAEEISQGLGDEIVLERIAEHQHDFGQQHSGYIVAHQEYHRRPLATRSSHDTPRPGIDELIALLPSIELLRRDSVDLPVPVLPSLGTGEPYLPLRGCPGL